MEQAQQSPFYLRFGITIISLAVIATTIYFAHAIILPLFFGILLAILLLPVTRFLQKLRLGRVASIIISILAAMIVIGCIVYFLSTQVAGFIHDFPTISKKFKELLWNAQTWIHDHFKIGMREQREYLDETTEKMKTGTPAILQQTVLTLTGAISYLVFLPIYSFLILYHKDLIKRFLLEICTDGHEDKMHAVLYESQVISQQYITGLLIELCIVFALNTAGFLLLGVKYAVFLALLSAILNIVPYIGMLIANLVCVVVTLVSSSHSMDAVWVCVILAVVQLIDNNVLMPWIVGNKVKLNALAIIIGVLVAGALAGVGGMFLAIPGLAVLKLIFERVDNLKPWAILLGDETRDEEDKKNPVKNSVNRSKSRRPLRRRVNPGGD